MQIWVVEQGVVRGPEHACRLAVSVLGVRSGDLVLVVPRGGRSIVPWEPDDAFIGHLVERVGAAGLPTGTVAVALFGPGALPDASPVTLALKWLREIEGLHDIVLVSAGRWWSMNCTDAMCCPPAGRVIRSGPGA